MTGADIDKNFDWKIDKPFSAYISNAEKNRLFRNTLVNLADKKWLGLNNQKDYDELASMVTTEAIFLLNNNVLHTAPQPLTNIVAVSGTYTLNTYFPHNMIVGDTFTPSLLTGFYAPLNGQTLTVSAVLTGNQFQFIQGLGTSAALVNVGTFVSSKSCPDYLHHFASKARFVEVMKDVVVTGNGDLSPIRITCRNLNSVREGDELLLSGFTDAALNGTFFAKYVNSRNFDLYLNQDLTQPTPATTTGTGTGTVSRIYENWTVPIFSDRKIDPFTTADIANPGIEFANKLIKIYPRNKTCLALTMDYMRLPNPFIDVNDNTTDLELIYPSKFIYRIIAEAALLYSSPSRDNILQRDMQMEIIQNP